MEPASPKRKDIDQAFAAADSPELIENDRDLAQARNAWSASTVLGVDTEFLRERTYWAKLGLVQVSDGSRVWLIDPLKVSNLEPLIDTLADDSVTKVFHSGSEDYEVLYKELLCRPAPVIDTQVACAMLGQPLQLGYHHAAKWLLGLEIAKDQTRSNWLKRPLSRAQLRYAALDVVFLPMMATELHRKLEEAGRGSWLLEDVERIQSKSMETLDPNDAWSRMRGAANLDEAAFGALVNLARWREKEAQKRDIARGFIVSDTDLLTLARRRPTGISEIEQIETIHPKAVSRYGDRWLKLIDEKPRHGHAKPEPVHLNGDQRRRLKAMKRLVSNKAAELGIDQALLASNKDLHTLLMNTGDSSDLPEKFDGWRKDVVVNDLLAIVNS